MTESATQPATEAAARALWAWRLKVFVATWLCYVGFYFCRKPFSIAKKDLGDAHGFTPGDLATIYATYLVAYMVGQLASGAIGPRFGPRRMLLAGMGVSCATAVGLGFAEHLLLFAGLMAVNGLAQASGWSNAVANMAAWTPRGERGTVMGLWATNFQVGGVAAGLLASWALVALGLPWTFHSGALVLVAVILFFWVFQRNRPEDVGLPALSDTGAAGAASAAPDAEPVLDAPWDRRTWTLVLLIGTAYFGMKFIRYALWSWAPFVLQRDFGLRGDEAGYLSTVFDVCGIAGVVMLGRISDAYFRGRHALASLVMIVGLLAATLAALTVGRGSPLAFTVCIGFIGFTLYGPDALMTGAAVMDLVGKKTVRASGIIGGMGAAGSVVQEVLVGGAGAGLGPILAMLFGSALLTAASLAAFVFVTRRPPRAGAPSTHAAAHAA